MSRAANSFAMPNLLHIGIIGCSAEGAALCYRTICTIGADFLICPDNTIHQAFDAVQVTTRLPWLHIAEVVATEAATRGYKRVGLLGTQWLVESGVYPRKLEERELQWARPGPEDRQQVGRIIMDEFVYGVTKPESTFSLLSVIQRLKESGCDSVALGCTELPLVIDDRNSPLPTLDSTRLLARAALRKATAPSTPASSSPQTP